ncbi:hypothetical protein B0H14DRAFT_3868165 [Mycena olivaceomarginata]|nr:hypothetical protein B0H14DRAFT_3868165 [Mycena olivaceomarginata]
MRLTPLPRQLRAYSFPSTPAFWMPIGHPCIRNFVHCMPLIARLPSASMHTFSHALRTLASLLLRPPRSHAHNTAAQCSIISLPLTLAGFVSPQSAPPLPSTFAFAVRTLDPRCLPVDCTRYPPPTLPTARCLIPHPHALALHTPHARSALSARSTSNIHVLDFHHLCARSPPSTRSIPAACTLVPRTRFTPLPVLAPYSAPFLGPAVFVFSPPTTPFPQPCMVNVYEEFCLLRIAGKCRAQITEAELSVSVHVKRPSSARPDVSAALPGVTMLHLLASTTTSSRPELFLGLLVVRLTPNSLVNHCGHPELSRFKHFHPTDVSLHAISPTTQSLAVVSWYFLWHDQISSGSLGSSRSNSPTNSGHSIGTVAPEIRPFIRRIIFGVKSCKGSEEGAKYGNLGPQHIFRTNSPHYCSPHDTKRSLVGAASALPLSHHYGAGGTYAAASVPSRGPCTWVPTRVTPKRRGTAAVPIHIRWGVVFLWQGKELGAMVEMRAA